NAAELHQTREVFTLTDLATHCGKGYEHANPLGHRPGYNAARWCRPERTSLTFDTNCAAQNESYRESPRRRLSRRRGRISGGARPLGAARTLMGRSQRTAEVGPRHADRAGQKGRLPDHACAKGLDFADKATVYYYAQVFAARNWCQLDAIVHPLPPLS